MSDRYRTDVLVVGAGPVGLFAALELAERGIAVEIIDGQPRTTTRSYALALHPGSLELLGRHGLAAGLREQGHRIDRVAFYGGGERRCELDLQRLAGAHPFVLTLPQQTLEDALEERLREHGVKVRWSYRLAHLELGARRARARIDKLVSDPGGYVSAATRWVIDRTVETRAAFVIGADGYHSTVRRALGVGFEEMAPHQLFGIFELAAGPGSAGEVRVMLDDARSGVLWPIGADQLRCSFELDESWEVETGSRTKSRRVVQVGEDVYPFLDGERLRRLLAARAPWFGEPGEVSWSVGVRFEQRLASSFGSGSAWLAGDAAHVATPVGVQSMNVGLREARDLADAIHRVLRGEGSPELLDAYGREHREEWRRLLGATGVRAGSAAPEWVRRHRDRIVPCLPASGAHLEQLLRQLDLELAAPPRPSP